MIIPCIQVDATSVIHIPALLDGTRPVSYRGVRPEVQAGMITFSRSGTIYNLRLSNGSFYPLQERGGTAIFDATSNRRHGRIEGAKRTRTQDNDEPDTLHELVTGHNSYFMGQGNGFSIKNYPLPDEFTAAMLVASQGGTLTLDVGTQSVSGAIDVSSVAKWITLRKSTIVWQLWVDGMRIAQDQNVAGLPADLAGDIDALIGSADLPLATREFRIWNRFLLNEEIPSQSVDPPAADIRYTASSSTKNPVKNLAGEGYDGEGQPVIANIPANRTLSQDALGQPCTILNVSNLPRLRNIGSYNDYRKPILVDDVASGQTKKLLYFGRNFHLTKKGREIVRVLEIAK